MEKASSERNVPIVGPRTESNVEDPVSGGDEFRDRAMNDPSEQLLKSVSKEISESGTKDDRSGTQGSGEPVKKVQIVEHPKATIATDSVQQERVQSILISRSRSLSPPGSQMIVSPIQKNATTEHESMAEMSHYCRDHCIPNMGNEDAENQDGEPSPSPEATHTPPVAEIRIPTPQTPQAAKGDESCGAEEEETDYKTLFLCCQHSLHHTQLQAAQYNEENRHLKRQLIQLQKQLNTYRRNKTGLAPSWTIPVSTRLKKKLKAEA